jgi:hypothetical protein
MSKGSSMYEGNENPSLLLRSHGVLIAQRVDCQQGAWGVSPCISFMQFGNFNAFHSFFCFIRRFCGVPSSFFRLDIASCLCWLSCVGAKCACAQGGEKETCKNHLSETCLLLAPIPCIPDSGSRIFVSKYLHIGTTTTANIRINVTCGGVHQTADEND